MEVRLVEKRTGIVCIGAQSAASRAKRWDEKHPEAAVALQQSQYLNKPPARILKRPVERSYGQMTVVIKASQLCIQRTYFCDEVVPSATVGSRPIPQSPTCTSADYGGAYSRQVKDRKLKVFRILSERYHDCGKRFRLRGNLIAGLDSKLGSSPIDKPAYE